MRKILFLSFILTILIYFGCSREISYKGNSVCFKGKCVSVEIAKKKSELTRGLQFRTSLGNNSGMLFVFSRQRRHSFWMKDTLIPLDMIWMDYSRRIVHIEKNVPPCKEDSCRSYGPSHPALYVLEVNAGYSDKLGLKTGDIAEFRLEEL